jgi:hypothetical protein
VGGLLVQILGQNLEICVELRDKRRIGIVGEVIGVDLRTGVGESGRGGGRRRGRAP